MIEIQSQLSERAIELLALPDDTPCFILDVGYVHSIYLKFVTLMPCLYVGRKFVMKILVYPLTVDVHKIGTPKIINKVGWEIPVAGIPSGNYW